jgi:hypothetical protein
VLTTDQKGVIAELEIARRAAELGIARPRPPKNNQRAGIHWAKDFEFAATLGRSQGAIAQLGERLLGMQKVAGSSPAGSIFLPDLGRPRQSEQVGNPDQGVLQIVEPTLAQD